MSEFPWFVIDDWRLLESKFVVSVHLRESAESLPTFGFLDRAKSFPDRGFPPPYLVNRFHLTVGRHCHASRKIC
jgi:hypothetical protein